MLRLRDIMTTELVTIAPELSVRDAMELLVNEHVGGAPVVAQRTVVGVVSVTDLLAFAVGAPVEPDESPAMDLTEPATPEESVGEDTPAPDWFAQVDPDLESDVVQQFRDAGAPSIEHDRFASHTVSDVMNHVVCSLPSNTRVDAAADYMRQAGIHRVLVMDDGVLVGIVTLTDIAAAVADHKLSERTFVFGSMPGRGSPQIM